MLSLILCFSLSTFQNATYGVVTLDTLTASGSLATPVVNSGSAVNVANGFTSSAVRADTLNSTGGILCGTVNGNSVTVNGVSVSGANITSSPLNIGSSQIDSSQKVTASSINTDTVSTTTVNFTTIGDNYIRGYELFLGSWSGDFLPAVGSAPNYYMFFVPGYFSEGMRCGITGHSYLKSYNWSSTWSTNSGLPHVTYGSDGLSSTFTFNTAGIYRIAARLCDVDAASGSSHLMCGMGWPEIDGNATSVTEGNAGGIKILDWASGGNAAESGYILRGLPAGAVGRPWHFSSGQVGPTYACNYQLYYLGEDL